MLPDLHLLDFLIHLRKQIDIVYNISGGIKNSEKETAYLHMNILLLC